MGRIWPRSSESSGWGSGGKPTDPRCWRKNNIISSKTTSNVNKHIKHIILYAYITHSTKETSTPLLFKKKREKNEVLEVDAPPSLVLDCLRRFEDSAAPPYSYMFRIMVEDCSPPLVEDILSGIAVYYWCMLTLSRGLQPPISVIKYDSAIILHVLHCYDVIITTVITVISIMSLCLPRFEDSTAPPARRRMVRNV